MADFTKFGLFVERWRAKSSTKTVPAISGEPVIGRTELGESVTWPTPRPERASHLVAFAASGSGKTVLAANALARELTSAPSERGAAACLVLDPKGDLAAHLIQALAAVEPASLNRIAYLDPFVPGGFPFNLAKLKLGATPLDIRASQLAQLCATVSTATGSQAHLGAGARQLDTLTSVILGALSVPHERGHILLALDALALPHGLKALGSIAASERARQFLTTADLGDELRASCASRLRSAFAATSTLEDLVTAPTSVQWDDLLAPGRICIVDLGRPFGGLTSLQRFYANLCVRLAVDFLLERESPWPGHHVRIVLDEAQLLTGVLSDIAETLLTTGRSRGLSLCAITQSPVLIHEEAPSLLRVLLGNTSTTIVGRLSALDAELLARGAAPTSGVDESFSTVRQRLAGALANLADRNFFLLQPQKRTRFVSEALDVGAWERAASEHAADIARIKAKLRLPLLSAPRLTLEQLVPEAALKRGGRGQRGSGAKRGKGAPSGPGTQPSEPQPRAPRSRWG